MPRKIKCRILDEKMEPMAKIIKTYNVETTTDWQEALKDLLGGTIQTMLEHEIDTQLEEREEADHEYHASRNKYKPKTI